MTALLKIHHRVECVTKKMGDPFLDSLTGLAAITCENLAAP